MRGILFSLLVIFLGLSSGYAFQRIVVSTGSSDRISLGEIRRVVQLIVLMVLIPITTAGSFWIAPLKNIGIAALPFLGAFAVLFGGFLAYMIALFTGMSREQRAVFSVSGGFTNMGSLGGLVVFILLGEAGFALVAFYQIFEKFVYFLIGFPLARSHSSLVRKDPSEKPGFLKVLKDPFIIINAAALISGAGLNLSGMARPEVFFHINRVLVPLGSFGLLFSIGLAIRFGRMKPYLGYGTIIVLIKSLAVPAATFFIGYILGLGSFEHGLALKTVLILSAMPVGFLSLVPPTLYKMDIDLANTNWFLSTMSLFLTVPLLGFLVTL
jgi:predicted permease